jgi:hypothetical protein
LVIGYWEETEDLETEDRRSEMPLVERMRVTNGSSLVSVLWTLVSISLLAG